VTPGVAAITDPAPGDTWTRRDTWCAAGIVLSSLSLYVTTLHPGLGGPEDTPKFQFVGYVLGTAHPPGYPLYVLLSHPFVTWLPVGTIAYRANLFSAVLAAVACGLSFVIGRQLGASRWLAASAALALATGASYWRSAVIAEVYGLAAVIAGLVVVALLAWNRTGGTWRLLSAVGAFAAGLGNHLTVLGLAPAAAAFVLLRHPRALTARVLALAALLLAAGVAQYGFILLRSHQGAPYLESAAWTLPDLWAVVTAQRFADQRFAFSAGEMLQTQVPTVAGLLAADLGIIGLAGLTAGLVAMVAGRHAAAALALAGAAGMLGLVLNLSGDFQGFVTPALVLIWPVAAFGLEAIRTSVPAALVPRASLLIGAVAIAMPALNLHANYAEADQSRSREGRFFRAVYAQLPERSAVVVDDYWHDMVLRYLALTPEGGPDRDIVRLGRDGHAVRRAAGEGRRVFAFAGSATYLAVEGLRFVPATVEGMPIAEWLDDLRPGQVLAGAATLAAVPFELFQADRRDRHGAGRTRAYAAFARVVQRRGSAWVDDDRPVALAVEPEALDASLSLPASLSARADGHGARVELGGHVIVAATEGVAVAVFDADTTLRRTFTLPPRGTPLVPHEGRLYEFEGEAPCVQLSAAAWSDVHAISSSGSWVTTVAVPGTVVLETVADIGAALNAGELLGGGTARSVEVPAAGEDAHTHRLELHRTGQRRPVFRVAFDGSPRRARLHPGGGVDSLSLCQHALLPLFPEDREWTEVQPDFESEAYFGPAWSGADRTALGTVRRAMSPATLRLPLLPGPAYRLIIDAVADPASPIAVTFNGVPLTTCAADTRDRCEVDIPAALVGETPDRLQLSAGGADGAGSLLRFHGLRIRRMR
jgi:hypothetical protein